MEQQVLTLLPSRLTMPCIEPYGSADQQFVISFTPCLQITSYNLSLREIDTVQDEAEYVPNALEAVLRKGHLEMLREPLLQTILRFKWEAFAKWQVCCGVWIYADEVQLHR